MLASGLYEANSNLASKHHVAGIDRTVQNDPE